MRAMHDGREDGLEALESLDIASTAGFADLLERMSKTAFGARQLGEAFCVLRTMAQDSSCTIVVTVSGAMTVAQMDRVLCEMIDSGLAQIVVTTGAIMSHGLSAAIGGVHYKYDPKLSDRQLYERGYNRVYDTLEMEANLTRAEQAVATVLGKIDPSRPACSYQLNRALGQHLLEQGQMPSILGSAYQKAVPIYVPAFTDSELGLAVAAQSMVQGGTEHGGQVPDLFSRIPAFNPFLDLYDYTRRVLAAECLGIVTIGGGVPRNWAQQVGPFLDVINIRLRAGLAVPRFRYGVRICPEPEHWGGLSGCTYAEGVSWGKFVDPADGGRFAEVACDATIAWPILVRAVLESLAGDHSSEGST